MSRNRKRAMALFLVAGVLLFANLMQNLSGTTTKRVACVGDSLTYGTGIEDREENCYPVQLQNLLGTKAYRIGNFGVAGAAVQTASTQPYTAEDLYESSLDYESDYVILMLGTNDISDANWVDSETFRVDYETLVQTYVDSDSKPQVILVTPPVVLESGNETENETGNGKSDRQQHLEEVVAVVKEVGEEKNLPVLDFYSTTEGHSEWYTDDGIHINADGAEKLADMVYDKINEIAGENEDA